MGVLDREWHLAHPFPRESGEAEKERWREAHLKNCGCGRKRERVHGAR